VVGVALTRLVDDKGALALVAPSLGITLLNVEEERTFREQLPSQSYVDGQHVVREPELRLSLMVLVAANFTVYVEALKYLSWALTFFQANPVFTTERHPALDPRITRLTAELQTLNFEQTNQLWTFLGAKQLPSATYRIRLVALQDIEPSAVRPPITTIATTVSAL
jgi:hypothetical protein